MDDRLNKIELKQLLNDLAHDIRFYKDKIKELQDEFLDLVDQKKELVGKYNRYKCMYEEQLHQPLEPDVQPKKKDLDDVIHTDSTSLDNIGKLDYRDTNQGKKIHNLLSQGKIEEAHDAFFDDDTSLRNHIDTRRKQSEAQESTRISYASYYQDEYASLAI